MVLTRDKKRTFNLGGLTGDLIKEGHSAFVDDGTFAALSVKGKGHEMALVSGQLVKEGLPADN